jgi:hypothetical protein
MYAISFGEALDLVNLMLKYAPPEVVGYARVEHTGLARHDVNEIVEFAH